MKSWKESSSKNVSKAARIHLKCSGLKLTRRAGCSSLHILTQDCARGCKASNKHGIPRAEIRLVNINHIIRVCSLHVNIGAFAHIPSSYSLQTPFQPMPTLSHHHFVSRSALACFVSESIPTRRSTGTVAALGSRLFLSVSLFSTLPSCLLPPHVDRLVHLVEIHHYAQKSHIHIWLMCQIVQENIDSRPELSRQLQQSRPQR